MKKIGKVLALLLAMFICFGTLGGMTVYADELTDSTVQNNSDTTGEDTSGDVKVDGYCLVTVQLKDFKTDETDNIVLEFKHKDTSERKGITLTKADNWTAAVYLAPGKHTITFMDADENREIQLREEVLEVADAKSAAVSLTVTKVVNNNFFPKFLRNNTFTLILLAASSITYFVLKKRREAMQG